MNAGEINIKVTASMDDFNRTMTAVKSSADAAGGGAGTAYSKKFGDIVKDNFSEQKFGKIVGGLVGIGMADNMMRSAADIIRGDTTLGEALESLVSSVPIVGAAYQLGSSIGDQLGQAIQRSLGLLADDSERQRIRATELAYENDMKAAVKAEEDKKKANAKRIAEVQALEKKARAEAFQRELEYQNFNSDNEKKNAEDREAFKVRLAIQAAKESGDQEEALRLEMEKAVADERQKLMEGFGPGMVGASQEERDAFQRLMADREDLIRDEFDERLRLLRIEQEEQKKADKERAKEMMDRLEKEAQAIDQERIDAQAAGIGSASTALGSFKFDAYPATQKRQNDERMVRSLEQIRDKQTAIGFI